MYRADLGYCIGMRRLSGTKNDLNAEYHLEGSKLVFCLCIVLLITFKALGMSTIVYYMVNLKVFYDFQKSHINDEIHVKIPFR